MVRPSRKKMSRPKEKILVSLVLAVIFVLSHDVRSQETTCEDRLVNCDDYNKTICVSYPTWAELNCAETCKVCGKKEPPCLTGWSNYKADKTCIKMFGQVETNEQHSWDVSRLMCRQFGGDLVRIRNELKRAFVLDLYEDGEKAAWIGLKNVAVSGFSFLYVDGTSLSDKFHPWLPNNPDNSQGFERCVDMHPKSDTGGWNDYNCDFVLPYICSTPYRDGANLE